MKSLEFRRLPTLREPKRASKKAQSANSAVLVAIIAGMIILYILFLPSEERLELLGENNSDSNGDGIDDYYELLSEMPGRLQHLAKDEVEHTISAINLYTREDAEVLKEQSSIYSKNAWFDKESKEINFTINDVDNTDNVMVSFDVTKHAGRLIIKLNGYEVFNQEVKVINIPPIKLEKEYLMEKNTLSFEVSGVGPRFWRTNEYILQGFKIIADVKDISTRESKNIFIVSKSEKENLETVKLKFNPLCDPQKVGPLTISINNHVVLSAVPDCDILNTIEFSPYYLLEGENRIEMKADAGHYIMDQIKVQTKLKETPSYVYYFEVTDEQVDKIVAEEADINMTFRFVDDIEEKEADLIINGRKARLQRTTDIEYSKDIDMYVLDGTNSLKIVPQTTFDVVEMRIDYTER